MAPVCIVRIGAFSWGSNGTMAETNIIDFEVKQMTRDEKRGGVLSITRRLLFDPVVADDPRAFKLWLWILGMTRFKTGGGFKRGQLKTKYEDLAKAVRLVENNREIIPSRTTMWRILKRFVDAKWIKTSRSGRGILITVLKYDEYQRRGGLETSESVMLETSENQRKPLMAGKRALTNPGGLKHQNDGGLKHQKKSGENGRDQVENQVEKIMGLETSENVPQTRVNQGSTIYAEGGLETSGFSGLETSENVPQTLDGRASMISAKGGLGTSSYYLGKERANYIEKSESTNVASPKKLAAISADDVHALYLEMCPDLPRSKMTVGLRTVINARFKESKEQRTIAFWHWFFTYVSESDFLCGRVKSFKANLAWLVGPKNFSKIMAGQYENRDLVMPMPQTYREWLDYERRMMVADVFEDRFGKKGGNGGTQIDDWDCDQIAEAVQRRIQHEKESSRNDDPR
jgi:hypothetical protein